ncbi:uncharacterized protein LOC109803148 isoform X3 [Cajanus cajan]|uniref:uncharacterized protein LOC109803148 isoform X3 n=1 Tax=Cajanus cajan TaxID=3821 RepID=UPI0010FB6645|nr:uncharacterized protein LOC109803148 isoform X3 [Cajanus cajan]
MVLKKRKNYFHFVLCRKRHSEDYCSMSGICGTRSDGKVVNCPYGSPAVKPDALLSSKIQSLCPTITGNVCCTEAQFDTLRTQVQQAIPFLVGCPACLRNFFNLFCELTCSPNQSLFINVTSVDNVKCVDLILTVLYIILICVFLGWGLYHRVRERKPTYRIKSVSNVINDGALYSHNREKDENLPMQIHMMQDVPQNRNGVRLSAVQGYMTNFYRKYGSYVARHPIMVLLSSLAVVLLLCLGLIRFKVETRPEKVLDLDPRASICLGK